MRAPAPKIQDDKTPGHNSLDRRLMLACVIIVLLVYGRLFAAHFTFLDDRGTLTENPHFNPPSWSSIGYYWSHTAADLYVPVTYTLWGLLAMATYVPTPDQAGVHLDPHLFHAVNILLHAAAACLAFRLLRQLSLRSWASAAGVLFFAVHPLQVETVAWVSGTKDLLSGTLSLAAMCFYVRSAQFQRKRWMWFALATACYIAAMLSKPGAVVLPLLIVVLDRLILMRTWRQTAVPALIWLALAIPIIIIGRSAQAALHAHSIPLYFRPILAGNAIAFYVGKIIWPTRLAFDYGLRPTGMLHRHIPYAICAIIAALALAIWRLRKPWLTAGACWFVICLLPVLGLVSFDWEWYSLVADHYVYLAMFGPALLVAWFIHMHGGALAARIGIVLILLLIASSSFMQTRYWMNNRVLCERAIVVNPRSFAAHAMLGLEEAGTNPQAAIADCRKSLSIEPGYYAAAEVLEMILARQRQYAAAMDVINQVDRYSDAQNPQQRADPTRYLRRVAKIAQEQNDFHVAMECYTRILTRRPNDPDAQEGWLQCKQLLGPPRNPTTGPSNR